jgi:O-antigen/teichoic acid export membrane protein
MHRAPTADGGAQEAKLSGEMRTLARGGVLGLVGVVFSAVLQFALVVAVTRGLGAEGAGTFLEGIALFTIVANLAQLGANTGLVRGLSRGRALGRAAELRLTLHVALWPVLALSSVAGLCLWALASPLARTFFHGVEHGTAVDYIRVFALVLPLAPATMVALSATRGLGTMTPYVVVQNIALPALRLVIVLIVVAAGLGTAAVALGWAVPAALAAVATAAWLRALLLRAERDAGQPQGGGRSARTVATEFWRFSAPRGMASMLGMTVTWMDILLVGALRSTREAGIYAAASRLSIAGAYALQAVGMAIAPQISGLLAGDHRERVEELYRMATWWLMALSWPLYLTLIAFAPFVMGMFGPDFVSGQWALVILSAAMLVNLATGNVTVVLLMSGKSALNLINAATSLVLNAVLNVTLIPVMGITGAAIAWAVSIVFVNVAPVVQVRWCLGLRPPFGPGYAFIAVASGLCYGALGFAVRMLLGASATTLAASCVVGTAIYLLLLYRGRHVMGLSQLRQALAPRIGRPRRPRAVEVGA